MVGDLLDIARSLLGFKNEFSRARRERRDRIADYFAVVAQTIQDSAESFRQGKVPHGKCQEMLEHANAFTDVVETELGRERAEAYAQKLRDAHEVEMLVSEILGSPDPQGQIQELEKASGTFRALSAAIRAA
jgi:hypothetical protein